MEQSGLIVHLVFPEQCDWYVTEDFYDKIVLLRVIADLLSVM